MGRRFLDHCRFGPLLDFFALLFPFFFFSSGEGWDSERIEKLGLGTLGSGRPGTSSPLPPYNPDNVLIRFVIYLCFW